MSSSSKNINHSPSILVHSEKIRNRLEKLAQQINKDYEGQELDLVCLSNSAMVFTTDLMRLIQVPVRLHLLAFDSYTPTPKSGEVRLTLDLVEPIEGRNVLVVEGMIISGRTPLYIMNLLRLRQPASLELCAIGKKPAELAVHLSIKYCMFEFDAEWVTGYGIGHGAEKVSADLLDMSKKSSYV